MQQRYMSSSFKRRGGHLLESRRLERVPIKTLWGGKTKPDILKRLFVNS